MSMGSSENKNKTTNVWHRSVLMSSNMASKDRGPVYVMNFVSNLIGFKFLFYLIYVNEY